MKTPINPFPTTGYLGAKYFCDRQEETKTLLNNLINGSSTTLIAIRRIGKTGLIKHLFSNLPKGWIGIYTDILATENLNGFLNSLATASINAVPEKSQPGKKIWDFIKSLRPSLSFDPYNGTPQVNLDVKPADTNQNIDAVLRFLEQQPQRIVIAIDEFQQILKYPESNTDAWLRSIIQNLSNIVFIFSGSHQHLMAELFSNQGRPFYRSTQFIKLEKIPDSQYIPFIIDKFSRGGKTISVEIVNKLLKWAESHTYYVQLICNRLYSCPLQNITEDLWKKETWNLLKEQEFMFYKYRDLLTLPQWLLLKAIANEGQIFKPTSKDFITLHNLGSPATVLRSLEALKNKEMIYSDHNKNGEKYYGVYDVLFHRWIDQK